MPLRAFFSLPDRRAELARASPASKQPRRCCTEAIQHDCATKQVPGGWSRCWFAQLRSGAGSQVLVLFWRFHVPREGQMVLRPIHRYWGQRPCGPGCRPGPRGPGVVGWMDERTSADRADIFTSVPFGLPFLDPEMEPGLPGPQKQPGRLNRPDRLRHSRNRRGSAGAFSHAGPLKEQATVATQWLTCLSRPVRIL